MTPSKNNFLEHVRFLRQAVLAHGAELLIAGDTMQVLLRQGMTHWILHPQFLATIDGVKQYTTTFVEETNSFAGWLPYHNKRWPLASDKLAFKQFVTGAGLKTPEFSIQPDADLRDVVVKRNVSSFGDQVQGPYRSSKEHPINPFNGEYYERFTKGKLLKIWYWNGSPICVERDNMPQLKGDGKSTLGELMGRRADLGKRLTELEKEQLFSRSAALLAYCGVSIATVLPPQTRQIVEFRYGSTLMHRYDRKMIDLQTVTDLPWTAALADIGQKLHAGIPEGIRNTTVFTVDAILDANEEIWLLEMNSNPTMHPLVYPHMIASLMPKSGSVSTQQETAQAAPGAIRNLQSA